MADSGRFTNKQRAAGRAKIARTRIKKSRARKSPALPF